MKLKKGVNIIKIAGIVVLSLLLIITLSNLTFASSHQTAVDSGNEDVNEIDKAYSCLENEIGDKCETKSTKQAAFNLLAISHNSKLQNACKSSLNGKKKDNCWGETDTSNCNIKSTAYAVLALNHIGEKADNSVKWLLDRKSSATGLTWYLEIDAVNKSECTINGKKVTIEDNKKISGTPPAGLEKAYNDYWFLIKNIEQNYTISCDKNFITALIYQKLGSNVFHISSETKSASAFESVSERVNSYCLSSGASCDYEGTLWAAIALAKEDKDISSFIPYLTSKADETENRKYLPSAFLYILTGSDEYYSELIGLQKANSYWDESRNKFYDSALALLALQNINSNEAENTKKYLLTIQQTSGCWQSDTAFILYAGWPKSPSIDRRTGISYCEENNNFCVSIGNCNLADKLDNFYCPSSGEVCCKTRPQELTCSEKSGVICKENEECRGDSVIASDTNDCCIGDCVEIVTENECEKQGFYCRGSCSEAQEEKASYSSSCSLGQFCCGTKPEAKKGNLLIILLVILIFLVILAIIFRNQLRTWIFKTKTGYKSEPTKPFSRPPVFPIPMSRPFPPRMPARPQTRTAQGPQRTVDKEFEETMKKLKEMSK